jgi:hypothetical protein
MPVFSFSNYIVIETFFYAVGFYDKDGVFQIESQWITKEDAQRRATWLNERTIH